MLSVLNFDSTSRFYIVLQLHLRRRSFRLQLPCSFSFHLDLHHKILFYLQLKRLAQAISCLEYLQPVLSLSFASYFLLFTSDPQWRDRKRKIDCLFEGERGC